MSIKYRLLLMLLIPTIWVVVLATWLAYNRYDYYLETRAIVELSHYAKASSELIHELQKERGRSSGYFNSQGQKFGNELREQRKLTDNMLATYRGSAGGNKGYDKLDAARSSIAANLAQLAANRSAIDSLQGNADSVIGYYTNTIRCLVDGIRRIGELVVNSPAIHQALSGYINLIELKERTGITRAVYAGVFGRNSFNDALYQRALELEAETRLFNQLFRFTAPPAYVGQYDRTLSSSAVEEVDMLMRTARDNHLSSALNISPEKWFGLITTKIDLQKQVENHVAADILAQASRSMAVEKRNLCWLVGLFGLFAALSAWIYLHVYRGIVKPLRLASWTMAKLAKGDFNFQMSE